MVRELSFYAVWTAEVARASIAAAQAAMHAVSVRRIVAPKPTCKNSACCN